MFAFFLCLPLFIRQKIVINLFVYSNSCFYTYKGLLCRMRYNQMLVLLVLSDNNFNDDKLRYA